MRFQAHGVLKRGEAERIGGVDVRPRLQQGAHLSGVATVGGLVQRAAPHSVLGERLGALEGPEQVRRRDEG